MPEPTKVEQFTCPGCAADMEFDPESGGMKCRFCGHAEALAPPATTEPEWHPFDETLGDADGAPVQPLSTAALEVSCAGCGSVVAFEPPEVAGTCPFCGATIVAEPKAADPLVAPDAVLPAKVPGNAAQAEVRRWLATRWFAPNALQRMARQEGISGVYLPFWDYAADTESHYAGGRGEHYWDTEHYTETDSDGNTVQRSRQVQRTRWYPISGSVSLRFDNLLVAGTRSIAEPRLNGLEPWDLEALRPYEPAYLAGFKAQRYQIELPEGFEKAKERMAPAIERDVREDIGGDEQRIDHISTQYANVAFRHLLLPVWIGAYRFQGKVYQVAVNARTGEVQGERPYSVWKIVLLAAVLLLTVWLLIALGSAHR